MYNTKKPVNLLTYINKFTGSSWSAGMYWLLLAYNKSPDFTLAPQSPQSFKMSFTCTWYSL